MVHIILTKQTNDSNEIILTYKLYKFNLFFDDFVGEGALIFICSVIIFFFSFFKFQSEIKLLEILSKI